MKLIVTHHATSKAWLIIKRALPMFGLFACVPENPVIMQSLNMASSTQHSGYHDRCNTAIHN